MVAAGERVDASSDPLPFVYRAIFGLAVAVLVFAVLALPAAVLLTWFMHFRRLPDWVINVLAVVVASGVFFSVWRTTRFFARHRYRFSLRLVMILTATLAVGLSVFVHQLRLAERKHNAVQALWEDGSGAEYYLRSSEDSVWFCWLIERFGHDAFAKVTEVSVRTDRGVHTILDHQAEFTDLEVVRFGAGVTDQGLRHVGEFNRLSNLRFADFRESPLTDAGIKQLGHWTNLPGLGLYGCNRVTDAGLAHLAEMPALEELAFISEGMANTTLTDAGLVHVGRMRNLKRLFILGLPITDAGLDHLEGLESLRVLRVYRTQITKRGIERLQQELPQCEILSDVN
jgi:hypothetical protein